MEPNSTKTTLPLIPLDDVVVFPGMNLTLAIDAGSEEEVLLVPRSGEDFATVGTIARIDETLTLPGRYPGDDPRGPAPWNRRCRAHRPERNPADRGHPS